MKDYENIEQVPTDSEKIYRRDLAYYDTSIPYEDIINLARLGNEEAKRRLIIGLLGIICAYAARRQKQCGSIKEIIDPHTDFLELVSVGNFVLVEKLNAALLHPNPVGYLLKTAWYEMVQFRVRYATAISTPHVPGDYHHSMISLSQNHEELDAYLELTEPSPQRFVDYTPLYKALEILPEHARTLLSRLYGLGGYGVETMTNIAGGNSTTKAYGALKANKLRYLGNLRFFLEQKYPSFSLRYKTVSPHPRYNYEAIHIPECTMHKLRSAENTLRTQGATISMNKLRILSGVNTRYASAYLQRIETN